MNYSGFYRLFLFTENGTNVKDQLSILFVKGVKFDTPIKIQIG